MSDDKTAEIRARHSAAEVYQQSLTDRVQMHDDRAWLLAENDRLRAENERLRAALKNIAALDPDVPDALGANDLRVIVAQMGDLAVKALWGKP